MSKRRYAACLVLATIAASCGGGSDGPPGEPPAPKPRQPVVLELDRRVAEPGSTLELTVENRGRNAIEFGMAYRLEHRRGGRWHWLNERDAFILIAIVVKPGGRHDQKVPLPKELEPGRYRIVKTVTVHRTRRKLDVEVRFVVR